MGMPKIGSGVHVEFDGKVISAAEVKDRTGALFTFHPYEEGFFGVKDSNGTVHILWHDDDDFESEQVYTVTKPPTPREWPPQLGDIWTVGDEEYFVRNYTYDNSVFIIDPVDINGGGVDYASEPGIGRPFADFLALNPKLIRRRARR